MGYQVEIERDTLEVFSVYYWIGETAHIKYISAYDQEEADSKGRDMGLDVFDNEEMMKLSGVITVMVVTLFF